MIADRLRALPQDTGLAVTTSKRFSPDVSTSLTLVPSTPISTFGPPSPSSSHASSPRLNNFDLTSFTLTFPSIDELDELPGFNTPSVPNTAISASNGPKTPIPKTNMAFPVELLSYIQEHNVLLIDVRNSLYLCGKG
ncbi:uncharacterized protein LACBIDRAFT_305145 [Laccaria bicolor S238N-H82]|uniref:Predicted protein n=1 Tax=Laccaria bicolor (strain S238N-H82 / ATCC MYA-4686) TaxID=486041 RepID=B0CTI6_LACBS|nr:uncharacterized protein LACBIDRAFT_305145 [Laccaria bicolor S238N-H82]EDR14496.1 predicted protein [Laccaria bicolor S238N-H82]|eukprot:XP_001875055.1 predicted protein [Laccaria bicolor S238N-H82]